MTDERLREERAKSDTAEAIAFALGSAAWLLRVALAERLDTGAAAEMAAYRAMLVERPYAEFQDDPVDALARWALQDAAVTIYGRS